MVLNFYRNISGIGVKSVPLNGGGVIVATFSNIEVNMVDDFRSALFDASFAMSCFYQVFVFSPMNEDSSAGAVLMSLIVGTSYNRCVR